MILLFLGGESFSLIRWGGGDWSPLIVTLRCSNALGERLLYIKYTKNKQFISVSETRRLAVSLRYKNVNKTIVIDQIPVAVPITQRVFHHDRLKLTPNKYTLTVISTIYLSVTHSSRRVAIKQTLITATLKRLNERPERLL